MSEMVFFRIADGKIVEASGRLGRTRDAQAAVWRLTQAHICHSGRSLAGDATLFSWPDTRSESEGRVLSKHRTRRAALDHWQSDHVGTPVSIPRRTYSTGETVLVAEGTWHWRPDEEAED